MAWMSGQDFTWFWCGIVTGWLLCGVWRLTIDLVVKDRLKAIEEQQEQR
jgi:uncharacterized membrane protein YciS (DUF1049 family)